MNKFLPFLAILTLSLSQQIVQNTTSTPVSVSPADAKSTEKTTTETAKNNTTQDAKQESSSSATVVIVIVVILLLLLGVGAGFFFLKRKNSEAKYQLLQHPKDPKEV